MNGVFDWVLKKCGSSLEKALLSQNYSNLLKKEWQTSATNFDSDKGIALKAGHLTMGRLFNTLPERQAIEIAKSNNSETSYFPQERALIHLCGKLIVEAATDCLPKKAGIDQRLK
jgi:hypothetical protein